MNNPNKELLSLYIEMRQKALEYINFLIKDKFKKNGKIDHFVLAMGSYFFVDVHDNILHDFKYKRLDDFLMEWDSDLKLTGEGIKIYRDRIITNW